MPGLWIQTCYWENSISLFEHALKNTKDNITAHINLGTALLSQDRIDEAIKYFYEALKIDLPGYHSKVYFDLGLSFTKQGKIDEAINNYLNALKIDPACERSHINLGAALWFKGDTDAAIDKGFNNWNFLRTDEDLKNIRDTAYYMKAINKN